MAKATVVKFCAAVGYIEC